ncbi:MAG: glutamyl-tRNA reductase, partial [Flavobacteriales bacterium]|nr:glutamyl-tRNA reductase [Flavobacteriales bacterium]
MSKAIFREVLGDRSVSQDWESAMKTREGSDALEHLFRVCASLESKLVGEQEIITQMRKAHEWSFANKLSGDLIRIAMRKAIEIAKSCYSNTRIATRPISTAFLAWQDLKAKCPSPDAKIVFVGAGQIISNLFQFVRKSHYTDITVVNRTLENAEKLVAGTQAKAISLEEFDSLEDFDAMVTCTGASKAIINSDTYEAITAGSKSRLIIDLAVPGDVAPDVKTLAEVQLISLAELQAISERNKTLRRSEVTACETIIAKGIKEFDVVYKQRQIERAMRDIPMSIKQIRETAVGQVFAKDLEGLDEHSQEVIQRIMDYMEKKYVSVPMKLAREVMLD